MGAYFFVFLYAKYIKVTDVTVRSKYNTSNMVIGHSSFRKSGHTSPAICLRNYSTYIMEIASPRQTLLDNV